MADTCIEIERFRRIEVDVNELKADVGTLKTGQAVLGTQLENICKRQDEHHAGLVSAIADVKSDNTQLSVQLLNEVRANRPSDPLKNPRLLALAGLLIVALAAPQLVGPYVSAVFMAPAIESIAAPEVVEVPVVDSEAVVSED